MVLTRSQAQQQGCLPLLLLPPELLLRVLRCLDARTLACVSQANRHLRQAAATALSCLTKSGLTAAALSSIQQYLSAHGRFVTRLQLAAEGYVKRVGPQRVQLLELPALPQLRELSLEGLGAVQLSKRTTHAGVLSACRGLTQLRIEDSYLVAAAAALVTKSPSASSEEEQTGTDSGSDSGSDVPSEDAGAAATFADLASLTGLQHLELVRVRGGGPRLPGSVLSSLQQLTHLNLLYASHEGSVLRHLSTLSRLVHLRCYWEKGRSAAGALSGLQHLHQLTALDIGSSSPWLGDLFINNSSVPALTRLSLQRLHCPKGSSFDASLLSHLTGLQDLGLDDVTIPNPAALLVQLAQLQQLSSLRLTLDTRQAQASSGSLDAAAAAAYSAITAGSSLRELLLNTQHAPRSVWQAMFPADSRQYTQLTKLTIWEKATATNLDGSVLAGVVSCCPNLQDLRVWWPEESQLHPSTTSSLSALTALTALDITHCSTEGVKTIATLTNLRCLELSPPNQLFNSPQAPLLALTVLRQLTKLWQMEQYTNYLGGMYMKNEAADDEAPDVWQQLQELFAPVVHCA